MSVAVQMLRRPDGCARSRCMRPGPVRPSVVALLFVGDDEKLFGGRAPERAGVIACDLL